VLQVKDVAVGRG